VSQDYDEICDICLRYRIARSRCADAAPKALGILASAEPQNMIDEVIANATSAPLGQAAPTCKCSMTRPITGTGTCVICGLPIRQNGFVGVNVWHDEETGQYIAELNSLLTCAPTEEQALLNLQLVARHTAETPFAKMRDHHDCCCCRKHKLASPLAGL